MFNLVLRWIINSCALMIVTYLVPGIEIRNFYSALIAVLFLSIVNAILRPILLFLTFPINILTLGIFTLFINALMFWFVASFTKGFYISNYITAFWAALIYWIITWATNALFTDENNKINTR